MKSMKIGTKLERVFKYIGVQWLGYESCGCEARRDKLDELTFNRNE